jgi:hypothetical protein
MTNALLKAAYPQTIKNTNESVGSGFEKRADTYLTTLSLD